MAHKHCECIAVASQQHIQKESFELPSKEDHKLLYFALKDYMYRNNLTTQEDESIRSVLNKLAKLERLSMRNIEL